MIICSLIHQGSSNPLLHPTTIHAFKKSLYYFFNRYPLSDKTVVNHAK